MKFEHCPDIKPTAVNSILLLSAGGGQSPKHSLQNVQPLLCQ